MFAGELVKKYSKPGDLVVDPFAGAGTIPLESALQGRRGDLATPPAERPRHRIRADDREARGEVPADGVGVVGVHGGRAAGGRSRRSARSSCRRGCRRKLTRCCFRTTTAGCFTTGAARRRGGFMAWSGTRTTRRARSASR